MTNLLRNFWILLILAIRAVAQTPLTLRGALDYAMAHRPELRAAAARVESSTGLELQAGRRPNPRFYFQSEDLHPSDFRFPHDAESYAFFSQVFETGGKRELRSSVAHQAIERSRAELDRMRHELRLAVSLAYWNAAYLQRVQILYIQDQDYFHQLVDYHQARFHEGKIAEIEVLRVRLEAERIAAVAGRSRLEAERAMLELDRELGAPDGEAWHLAEDFELLEPPTISLDPADAVSSRAELRSARAAVAAAQSNVLLQQANTRPDIESLFGYKRNGPANTAIVGLQMNLPLFDRNQGSIAAAEAETRSAQETLEATRSRLSADFAISKREYEMRRDQSLQVFKPLVERAVEISGITRAAYREGGIDLVRLLDAERLRIETQLAWIESLGQYHKSVANLEYSGGVQ